MIISIDVGNIDQLFTSTLISQKTYVNYVVIPSFGEHCLIRINPRQSQIKSFFVGNTKNESYNIMDYLCQNYYINVNAYSSIRYLLSSIIIISDWYYYINEKDIQGKQIQPIVKRNCFYNNNRYCILKQLNEN